MGVGLSKKLDYIKLLRGRSIQSCRASPLFQHSAGLLEISPLAERLKATQSVALRGTLSHTLLEALLACRLRHCFCFAEVSTGHPQPLETAKGTSPFRIPVLKPIVFALDNQNSFKFVKLLISSAKITSH